MATVIKKFLISNDTDLIKYYMALRINTLFNVRTLPVKVSYVNTPYYEYAVESIRKCYHEEFSQC